ncbi:hypothetical protein [Azospirillum doebereinerae]|uniref:Uncharacterized protein n=1 Tax=Azospirillum doebereinerae TaxID=92933 RepID=A0A3S0WQ24_9PROT|nr:hypothetical protein [Azospirillum doebereinerae]RUQ59754.1 hypothetical protein EJ913_31045 [Azospirillum doebereinerae]
MAIFNGRSYTLADFLPWSYTEIWDQFWNDVLVELGLRAAAVGAAVVATSSTNSVAIGTGVKTLTVETGKGFVPGMWVVATDAANSANSLTGSVTSYNTGTGALVLSVPTGGTTGSGTPTAWTVGLGGKLGPVGPAGNDGLMAAATDAETAAGVLTTKAVTPASAVATFFKLAGGTLTGWLRTAAGSAATPGLQVGEAGTGLYLVSAGVVAFVTGAAVEAWRVLATGAVLFGKAVRGQIVALTWASTVTIDANQGNYFSVTLAGATTFANPTNLTAGQPITIIAKQDGTGSRTASWGSYWKFPNGTAPTLSTAAGKTDRIVGHVVSATEIHALAVKGF